jgi:putative Ca2+/H+ antiporter (TMEM165/GDT1 family)
MDLKLLATVFATVFVAELGDKTQLATLLFASDSRQHPALVFVVAAAALCLSTAIAVLLGNLAGHYLTRVPLKLIAGLGFIVIGLWTLYGYFRAA